MDVLQELHDFKYSMMAEVEHAKDMIDEYHDGNFKFKCSLEFGWFNPDSEDKVQLHSVTGYGDTIKEAKIDAGRNLERYEHKKDDAEIMEFIYIIFPSLDNYEYCVGANDYE